MDQMGFNIGRLGDFSFPTIQIEIYFSKGWESYVEPVSVINATS